MNFHGKSGVCSSKNDKNKKNPKNVKCTKSTKKVHKYKSTQNSVIFEATDFRFCIEVHMHCPTKWESTKVQKYKSTNVQKYKKYKKWRKKC